MMVYGLWGSAFASLVLSVVSAVYGDMDHATWFGVMACISLIVATRAEENR